MGTKAGNELAAAVAKSGFEQHRDRADGCGLAGYAGPLDGSLIYFNNCPFSGCIRDEQLAEFREQLQNRGIEELGFASFPESGPHAGHTIGMVFDCGEEEKAFIRDTWAELIAQVETGRTRGKHSRGGFVTRGTHGEAADLAARLLAGRSDT